MSAIPVKLSHLIIEKIDYLVKMGKYKNRSQAIREFITKALEEETLFELENEIDFEKITELIEYVGNKQHQNERVIEFTTTKSAAELIAEDRDR